MFKRNGNKVFSFSLVATVLATGLMAQGAAASVEPKHEAKIDPANDAEIIRIESNGPQGEVLVVKRSEGYMPDMIADGVSRGDLR